MMIYSEFIQEASRLLRTSRVEVERLIITAPYRYKHYTIPKRNGRPRDIHHPTPALKAVQRWMTSIVLSPLPVHDCVYSYRRGRNIAMHAAQHLRSNYVTRFDFADFFPSVSASVLRAYLLRELLKGVVTLDRETVDAVVRLSVCHKKASGRFEMSIGAPSSPFLSNALLYSFDARMNRISNDVGCVYTRYADDIYVSGRSKASLQEVEAGFLVSVAEELPYLRINEAKTQHLSRKRRVSVTGVNLTSDRKVSVGRELKRSLATRVFLALRGELEPHDLPSLRGMLSHVKSVEPEFIAKLSAKYGAAEVDSLIRNRI